MEFKALKYLLCPGKEWDHQITLKLLENCRIAMYINMKSHWSNINANDIFLKEQKKLLIQQKSKKENKNSSRE